MSPLATQIGAGVLALFALLTLRGKRWAYFGFVLLGLLYFPAQAHFHMHVPKCEQIFPTVHQLVPLLHNYLYIALFAGFYWLSWVQCSRSDARWFWALSATLLVAVLFEIAEGATPAGRGHCRVRDLSPDVAGALGAAVLLAIWSRLTRKPAYVRLGRPRAAAAPRPAAPPPRAVLPPRAVVYDPSAYAPPPPPRDFSPGPTTAVTPAAHAAPTQEVARTEEGGQRAAVARHLQTILGRLEPILRRLRPMLQRPWGIIRRRRRAIVVGVFVLALVAVGVVAFLRLSAPPPVAIEQPPPAPPEPPPPPPRPLQSEVEGYYEPNYEFTVSDRRFIRVTLRPEPFLTFARFGAKQQVRCADARIDHAAVYLRCRFETADIVVTIDGRFSSRYVTNRLDMPVLSALITVTSIRGEVVYRARDSFYWHVPDPSL